MFKRMILIVFLLLLALSLMVWGIYTLFSQHPADYTEATLTIHPTSTSSIDTEKEIASSSLTLNGHVFYLDLADTMAKRAQGLSGRENLADDQGMLFLFPYFSKQSFWMHGMNFPLDIIWIADDTIVDISQDVPMPLAGQSDLSLPQYAPSVPVNRVLEINAGLAAKYGVKIGDKIKLRLAGS